MSVDNQSQFLSFCVYWRPFRTFLKPHISPLDFCILRITCKTLNNIIHKNDSVFVSRKTNHIIFPRFMGEILIFQHACQKKYYNLALWILENIHKNEFPKIKDTESYITRTGINDRTDCGFHYPRLYVYKTGQNSIEIEAQKILIEKLPIPEEEKCFELASFNNVALLEWAITKKHYGYNISAMIKIAAIRNAVDIFSYLSLYWSYQIDQDLLVWCTEAAGIHGSYDILNVISKKYVLTYLTDSWEFIISNIRSKIIDDYMGRDEISFVKTLDWFWTTSKTLYLEFWKPDDEELIRAFLFIESGCDNICFILDWAKSKEFEIVREDIVKEIISEGVKDVYFYSLATCKWLFKNSKEKQWFTRELESDFESYLMYREKSSKKIKYI